MSSRAVYGKKRGRGESFIVDWPRSECTSPIGQDVSRVGFRVNVKPVGVHLVDLERSGEGTGETHGWIYQGKRLVGCRRSHTQPADPKGGPDACISSISNEVHSVW